MESCGSSAHRLVSRRLALCSLGASKCGIGWVILRHLGASAVDTGPLDKLCYGEQTVERFDVSSSSTVA